ncbi:putative methyltransferase-domain-containing protein [Lactarius hengduanensis]|nr:putative methyltransferase-domain-containing protein [Lactarius hengduanensis]
MTAIVVLPPTSRLPPIKALGTIPVGLLHEAIQYLQAIYNPEICGSRRVSRGADTTASWDAVRADAFEHVYAIRWLTALIAQATTHADADGVETLVQSAAALLAICAGAASAGTRTRTYAFGGSVPVRVQLTDVALRNDDFGSVGAQTWGSACVLAEMIVEEPARFGLGGGPPDAAAAMVRVLELGAGTGLVSLTIGKILDRCGRAEIVASDFHPLALENLRLNIENNNPCSDSCGLPLVSAHFLDWQEAADPANALEAPFDVQFDEVFGADVIYEVEHAAWISACLKRLVRLTGRFHLVIPIREGFARESTAIERLFPRVEDMHRVEPTLCITQKESIICEAEPDGAAGSRGDVEYAHYTIQWTDGRYGQPAGLHEE